MSYILDALRRAQAERGRGAVPGLHTPVLPAPGTSPPGPPRAAIPGWLAVTMAATVAVLAAGAAWWALQPPAVPVHQGAGPVPVPGPGPVPREVEVATTPLPSSTPAPPPGAVPEPALAVPMAPGPAARTSAQGVVPRAAGTAPQRGMPPPPDRKPAQAPPAASASPPPSAPPPHGAVAAPTGTIFAPADLPDAVRAQLPVLQISGATYSSNPEYRMAIVNGQVLHEGDPAAPGLLLEKIEPGRTVWSFQGYRYGLASR